MKSTFIYAIALVLVGCFGKEPEKTGMEGKPLPSFKLFLADSTTYFDTKDIPTGKPVVLFFFGPHCPYSKLQAEEIVNNMQSLKDVQFYFFTTWSFRELKQFYAKYELKKYPNIVAGVDYTNFFADQFSAQGVPYMAIYGKDKRLREAFIGKIKSSQIKSVATD
jgi:thiol-disulfide isomerase/thioredoxin